MKSTLCLPALFLSASSLRLQTEPAVYPWAGKNGDALRTGASAFFAPSVLEKGPTWSFHEADEMTNFHRSQPQSKATFPHFWGLIRAAPLIDDKLNIYISTVTEGRVYKFSSWGQKLWSFKHVGAQLPGIAAIMDGKLFTASSNGNATALDMDTGKLLWSTKIADTIAGDTWSMSAAEGVVIAPAMTGKTGNNRKLVAMKAADGSVMWTFTSPEDIYNILVAIKDGSCVFSTATGRVFRLDLQTGKTIWMVAPPSKSGFSTGGSVLGPDGRTVYTTWNAAKMLRPVGMVAAVNFTDGARLWTQEVSYEANNAPAVGLLGSRLSVVVGVGSNPYPPIKQLGIASGKGGPAKKARILALDALSGKPRWSRELPPWHGAALGDDKRPDICLPDAFSNPAIGGDGTVYVGFQSGLVYSVKDGNNDGTIADNEVSSFQTGAAFQGSPGIAPGMLVATSCDGMHVFRA